jgi:5-methylcytosine-specific restriction endonuclease McrA
MGVEWSEGRRKTFITSLLRSGFRKYPSKYATLKAAYVGKKLNSKTKRVGSHYKCAKCKKVYPSREVQVDHIQPVVDPIVGFVNWDEYIDRLFCEESNLQVLCLTCHDGKTKKEKIVRVKNVKK